MGFFKPGQTYVAQKAFIFRKDGKFLTMRRTKTAPAHPLTWDLPGGVAEFGEDPLPAMRREIREETNLTAGSLRPFDVEAHASKEGVYWFTVMYAASEIRGTFKISWEHDLYKWVTLDEFLKLKVPRRLRGFAVRLFEERKKRGGSMANRKKQRVIPSVLSSRKARSVI